MYDFYDRLMKGESAEDIAKSITDELNKAQAKREEELKAQAEKSKREQTKAAVTMLSISTAIQESFVKRVKFTSMKKVIMFLLLSVMMTGVVSSCKSENKTEPKKELSAKDELLIEAKNGLKNYINDRARNPETGTKRAGWLYSGRYYPGNQCEKCPIYGQ